MKKIYFVISLMMSFVCAANAQSITSLDPQLADYRASFGLEKNAIVGVDGITYMYMSKFGSAKEKNYDTDYLLAVDGDNISKTSIVVHEDCSFAGFFDNNEEVFCLYYEQKKIGKNDYTTTFYLNKITKGSTTASWNPVEIAKYSVERIDRVHKSFAISADKSKIAFLYFITEKDVFKGAMVHAFDMNGEQLWQNRVALEFSNKTFSVEDLKINDAGTAFITILSYTDAKKTRNDDVLHVYAVDEFNVSDNNTPMNFHSNSVLSKVLKNGNLFVGGFYYEGPKDNTEIGSFSTIFDAEKSSLGAIDVKKFTDYEEGDKLSFVTGKYPNQRYRVNCTDVFELPSGTIVLTGEQQMVIMTTDQNNHIMYRCFNKSIPLVYCEPNGTIQQNVWIFKDQSASAGVPYMDTWLLGISYHPFLLENNIGLFFNDNVNNYSGKNTNAQQKDFLNSKVCAVMVMVDENGSPVLRKKIIDPAANKKFLLLPLAVDNQSLYFIGATKKALSVDKLILNY